MKTNAECKLPDSYGLLKKTGVNTTEECAQEARNAGVGLFLSCDDGEFKCYIYAKTQGYDWCYNKKSDYCSIYEPSYTFGKSNNASSDGHLLETSVSDSFF